MAFILNIGKCSLLGNYRENNEDSIDVKVFPDPTVGIVADGMGGQAAGEIASKRAVEIIPRDAQESHSSPQRRYGEDGDAEVDRPGQRRDHGDGRFDKDMKNMGTTVVMALWRKGNDSSRGRRR